MLPIHLAIIFPFLTALIILLFLRRFKKIHLGWLVLIVPAILFIQLSTYIPKIASGQTFQNEVPWIPTFDINFLTNIDGLSLIFGLLITGIGTLVILYSIYYLATDPNVVQFYIYLLLFMGSMLGVVFSDHLIVLYVFWELTSISSFLLIAYWYQRKGSRYGAKKALHITVIGGFFMLVGFLMLHHLTGTFQISEMITQVDTWKNDPLLIWIIVFILIGAFTKSAQFPFHIWLPDAMEAPTPISAYLHSATMVKAGIYIVARFTPVFGGETIWFILVSTIGLLTLFWGAFTAIRQTDLKALLAYSTVSQLGLIMTLFGVGSLSFHPQFSLEGTLYTQAIFAALFHLMNHSTFKGALFMIVGIIDYQIGTRDLRRLGGLASLMPISFTIAMIGSFSMAGLPPFNGFLSKEMFFTSMLQLKEMNIESITSLQTMATFFPIIAWVASVFTFIYCMMIVFQTFFGPFKIQNKEEAKEPSFGMLIPPIILGALVVFVFFFPNILGDHIIKPAIYSIYPNVTADMIGSISQWHGFNTELMMTIGIIILGSIIYIYLTYFKKVYVVFPRSLSFDALYNNTLEKLDIYANKITNFYMTGYLRDYIAFIFSFFTVLLLGVFFYVDAFAFSMEGDAAMNIFAWILVVSIIIAGMTILLASSRLTAIVVNGYIGFAIAMFFVLFRAPDLALTQLVVETVTTALFLLCFYFLPEWEKEKPARKTKVTNMIIAISVGVTFTLIALSVKSGRLFESISTYFEKSEELTGAKNIVNTVLGDFRAFDTMLEVIVLLIAGIGVYTLIKYKDKVEVKHDENE
ncbi:Na+/H+ antiporter subunit A [Pseudogracilibacillus sp. ICA-222130]|uniref:Na+/H+ antiporter subunit A n=1 Tax=Pseudogracilibacillus sp. ICA-222130 TaxID=3134655 RepID=UPI0030BA5E48